VASVNDVLAEFLLTWLRWWGLLVVAYGTVLFTIDALLSAWQRRQQGRRLRRAELDRINREARDTVQRIGSAFVLAQQLIRDEAAAERVRR
jgi:hypothetical protein